MGESLKSVGKPSAKLNQGLRGQPESGKEGFMSEFQGELPRDLLPVRVMRELPRDSDIGNPNRKRSQRTARTSGDCAGTLILTSEDVSLR